MDDLDPAEVSRFWSYVVAGPGPRDCWLWCGSISDDAYGRFWITRHGRQRVVRPHRYALAAVTGCGLDEHQVVEHLRCDNPICVRVEGTELDHIVGSTQAANIARIGPRGRGRASPLMYRWAGTDRATVAARSRALRAAVCDGWDPHRIEAALANHCPGQGALW